MNPLKFPLVALSVSLFVSSLPVVAQNLYWDTNSGTGGIQGGNGNWNSSNYWNDSSTGSGTFSGWTTDANGYFSAGSSTVSLESSSWDVGALTVTGGITVTLSSGTINLGIGYTNNNLNAGSTLNATIVLIGPQTFSLNGTGISNVQGTLDIGTHALTINAIANNRVNIATSITGSADITVSTENGIGALNPASREVVFTGNNNNFTGDYILNKGVMGIYSGTAGYTAKSAIQFGNTADNKEFHLYAASATVGGLNSNGGSGDEYVSLGSHSSRLLTIDTSITGGGFDFAGTMRELAAGKILSLTKTGTGSQGFSGTNTLTGNILISGGTLQIGNGGTTGSFTGINAITNNANLTINRSNDFNQSTGLNNKAITGTGSVTQAGSGALILDVANSYTGGTTITGGTLVIAHTTGASNGTITQTDGSSLLKFDTTGTVANNMSVYNVASNQTVTLSGNTTTNNATYDVASGTTLTVNGKISGSGSVTMNGIGTLALAAANDYSGGTSVTTGTLQIGDGGTTGSVVGTITAMGGGVLEFNRSDATTLSNTLAGNGTFRQIGGNTLTLDGTNTTNGTIAVTSGTILFSGANALPSNGSLSASANATLSVADGTTRSSSLAGGLTMDGGNFVFDINSTASDSLAFSGAASLSGTNVVKLNLSNATASSWTLLTAASGLDGGTWSLDMDSFLPGELSWTLSSTSTALTLSAALAANNFYWTGNTSASWGVADNWSSDSAGSSPRVATPTAADDLFFTAATASNLSTTLGANFTVNTMSITDPGVSIAAGYTITANASMASAIFVSADSGTTTIAANLAGANAGLTKSGNGSLTLSGTNTYGGATTISAGTFQIGVGGASGSIDSTSAISNDGTLVVNRSGTIAISAEISGSGDLINDGGGTLILSGSNSFSGGTTLNSGTLVNAHASAAGTGAITQASAGSLLKFDTTGTVGNDMSVYNVASNKTLTLTGNTTTQNASYDVSGGTTLTINGKISGTGSLTMNGTGTLALGAANDFSGGLVVNTGAVVLTGSNAYTGGTTINGGTLQIGNGGSTGSLGNYTITNNGTLVFNTTSNLDLGSADISGTGDLIQNGTGELNFNLSGKINSSGNVTINSGTIRTRSYNTWDNANLVVNGGTFSFIYPGSSPVVFSSVKLISGQIINTNVSTSIQTLQATNGFVFEGGTLGANITLAGGSLTKNGSGTLELNAANTFTGATVVNTGTLKANAAGALATTSNITVTGGSLLVTANNAIGDSVDIDLAGGNLAFSGNVTDTIGALTLSANSVIDLGTGSVVAIFADLFMGNYTLAVHNWTGTTLWNGGTGNNTDQIYFNRALGSGELDRISFYSDFGSDFLGTGFQLGLGSGFQYEVIPVPEAETWVGAALLLAGAGVAWMRGRRRREGLNMDGQDQQDLQVGEGAAAGTNPVG